MCACVGECCLVVGFGLRFNCVVGSVLSLYLYARVCDW